MNLYDEHYSAYFDLPSADYPEGSAINCTDEDSLDGTPYLAEFFNDVIGFMQAVFHGVFGNPKIAGAAVEREVSGEPETAQKSDVWDAIKTFVQRKIDAVTTSIDEFINSKGKANGLAPLDANGLVSSAYLPSYVDDVLEFASRSAFPDTGETGKIYVSLDNNKSWRWSGSTYIELSKYDDATTTASGLMSASDKQKLNGIESGAQKNPNVATTSANGLMSAGDKQKLDGIESGAQKNAVTSVVGQTGAITTAQVKDAIGVFGTGANGLVPGTTAGDAAKFLMGDGSWGTPAAATIDGTLSETSTNAVQNKVVTANMYTVICTTSASTQAKVANIDGFVLTEGCTVRILFKNANTANNPKLQVNSYDAMDIVAYRNGDRILLSTTTDASGNTRGWDAYTTLELVYDGADFVVMGNPVLLSNFGTDSGYEKKANGLLVQWIKYQENNPSDSYENKTLPLSYTSNDSYVAFKQLNRDDETTNTWAKSYMAIPQTSNSVRVYHDALTSNYSYIFAIGY